MLVNNAESYLHKEPSVQLSLGSGRTVRLRSQRWHRSHPVGGRRCQQKNGMRSRDRWNELASQSKSLIEGGSASTMSAYGRKDGTVEYAPRPSTLHNIALLPKIHGRWLLRSPPCKAPRTKRSVMSVRVCARVGSLQNPRGAMPAIQLNTLVFLKPGLYLIILHQH